MAFQTTRGNTYLVLVGRRAGTGDAAFTLRAKLFLPRLYRLTPGTSFSWRPPAAGRWRVRASYLGTLQFSPSSSGYVYLLVAKPLPAP